MADAIVRQTAKSTSPKEFVERISRRLHALSINQDLMIEHDWRGADIAQIIQWQLASVIDDTGRLDPGRPPFVVTPRVAQALGLAIYELATNAVKFGALSVPHGQDPHPVAGDGTEWHARIQIDLAGTRRPSGHPAEEERLRQRDHGKHDRPLGAGLGAVTYAPTGLIWELIAPETGLTGMAEPAPAAAEAVPRSPEAAASAE